MRDMIFWTGAFLLFFLLLVWGIAFGIAESMEAVASHGLSPQAWPSMVTAVLLVASAYLAWSGYKAHRLIRQAEQAGHEEAQEERPYDPQALAITMGLLFAYYFSVSFLGIALASVLFFIIFSWRSGEKRVPLLVAVGGCLSFGLYYFFLTIARIPMPTGPLGGVI